MSTERCGPLAAARRRTKCTKSNKGCYDFALLSTAFAASSAFLTCQMSISGV